MKLKVARVAARVRFGRFALFGPYSIKPLTTV